MNEDTNKSIWNIDEAEHKLIFFFKEETARAIRKWELINSYWNLRSLAAEIDARLTTKEQEELDEICDSLDSEKNNFESDAKNPTNQGNFFMALITAYKLMCRLLKKHGTFFREQDEDEGL